MKRSPTIVDVADAAGVSIATVSRVINGGNVKAPTRKKVETAMETLGYRRNTLARSLATGKTGVVGVLIPDVLGPLYGQMARGIEEVFLPLGMHSVIVSDNRDPEEEKSATELLLERQVDGLILIGSYLTDDILASLSAAQTPIVLVQREHTPHECHYDTIQLDNESGVTAAIEHLITSGHKHIAHLAGTRLDGQERARIFKRTLQQHQLTNTHIFETNGVEDGGFNAAQQLITQAPHVTAVFCVNDRVAIGLYHGLETNGVRVPDDISIIGFDDLPWTAYLSPPLTTLQQPARAMGQAAAQRILKQLNTPAAPELTIFPSQLLKRASVKNLQGGDA